MLRDVELVETRIREGRFQSWMALITAMSGILSGLEVAYQHYRGGYSRRVMYTPVILSGALTVAGFWGVGSGWASRTVLRAVSYISLLNSVVGFYFHVQGIARKPGGWRLPITNMVMGPPIFAPLLFGIAAYLGLIASYLRRDNEPALLPGVHGRSGWTEDLRQGRFQKHMAAATILSAGFSGFEAWYSHYKNNFRYWVQWTPVIIAPLLMASAGLAIRNKRIARTALPAVSALAILDGAIGFGYHVRGVVRRPGGLKKPLYNLIYGPPVFAPLLFAASGFLGILASLFRREKR